MLSERNFISRLAVYKNPLFSFVTRKINPDPNPAQHPFVASFLAHVLFLTNMKHTYEQGVPKRSGFLIFYDRSALAQIIIGC